MKHSVLRLMTVGAAVLGTGCSMFTGEASNAIGDDALAGAFESIPLAYSSAQSSFSATSDSVGRIGDPLGMGFGPGGPGGPDDHGGPGHHHGPGPGGFGLGPGFGPGGLGLMGGLGPEFFGGVDGGGPGHGPFADSSALANCTFAAATGRVSCPADTRDGITVTRSMAFLDAAGKAQAARDSLSTNTINTHIDVSGTSTRGAVTRTVSHSSDRTVVGLAAGSTKRTVNGKSSGTENSSGTMHDTAFVAVRVAGDTVTGVVVPVTTGTPSYPTAGTVVRRMKVTTTKAGTAAVTSDRREVITYDGTATAKLVITKDGTTTNCTIALPHARPVCG